MLLGRRVMIVGNGEVPEGAAATIDAADLVVRFNDCRSVGRGGTRTDIVAVCNTGRPALAMLGGGRWKTSEPVRQAREIWSVRSAAKFAAMRAALAKTHPDLDDFCDDYTTGFETFARATGRRHRVVPIEAHERLEQDLARFAPPPYVAPSSGLVVIADILSDVASAGDEIVLAGFGHSGWEWHPFAAERRYVDAHAAAGRLRRLNPLPSSDLSQGA
ncbi:Urease operon accessory protein [Sinorhizobium sp. CCBAU 05631]|uniref:Urease operon accessory protein n=1 Tax=Sinorhizobium sp. CCBAU 05631 TaxID=794846 RepID=UPI000A305480|nr:Urease operon accessory protein [Sinorhizobium sp. CCBAU 05631]ASY57540.1 small molecule metabolism [Sinorhizobium sp. CCBAU 05631]